MVGQFSSWASLAAVLILAASGSFPGSPLFAAALRVDDDDVDGDAASAAALSTALPGSSSRQQQQQQQQQQLRRDVQSKAATSIGGGRGVVLGIADEDDAFARPHRPLAGGMPRAPPPVAVALLEVLEQGFNSSDLAARFHRAESSVRQGPVGKGVADLKYHSNHFRSSIWTFLIAVCSALLLACIIGALGGLCPCCLKIDRYTAYDPCDLPVRTSDLSPANPTMPEEVEVNVAINVPIKVPTRPKTVKECLCELEGNVRNIIEEDRRPADWQQYEAIVPGKLPDGSQAPGTGLGEATASDPAAPPKDGSLTPLEKCKVILRIYDEDKDGYLKFPEAQAWEADLGEDLDRTEYEQLCVKMGVAPRRGLDEGDLLKIYEGNEAHLNADYEALVRKAAVRTQKKKVETIHKFFDRDKDGLLNLEEMQALCKYRAADTLTKDEFVALCVAFGSARSGASTGITLSALLKIYKELEKLVGSQEELESDFCDAQRHRRPSVDAGAWRLKARKRRLVEALQQKPSASPTLLSSSGSGSR